MSVFSPWLGDKLLVVVPAVFIAVLIIILVIFTNWCDFTNEFIKNLIFSFTFVFSYHMYIHIDVYIWTTFKFKYNSFLLFWMFHYNISDTCRHVLGNVYVNRSWSEVYFLYSVFLMAYTEQVVS